MTTKIIEARARISADDKTGKTFDNIAKKIEGVAKAGKALEGIKPMKRIGGWGESFEREIEKMKLGARELATIQRSWESFNRALSSNGPLKAGRHFGALDAWKDQTLRNLRELRTGFDETERAHKRFFRSSARFTLQAAGIGTAGYLANRGLRGTITSGATAQRESARDYLAGLTDAESDRLKREGVRTSALYPSVEASAMHERLRDTALSLRSMDKAVELSETIAQGTTVLQSLKGKDAAIEEGRKFFRALDVMGRNIDPKQVKGLFDGYVKALGVEGADLNLGDVLQLAKKARSAGGILSDRFLMTTGVGLIGDMGGPEVGTALATGLSQVVAGRATAASKAEQARFGLRDGKGKFLNQDLFMTDPDKWAWSKLMPALQKKGVDVGNDVAVAAAVSKLFSNRTIADLITKVIQQRQQYQDKALQYDKAPGLAAAQQLPSRDPFVAYEGFLSQLKNFAAAVSDPAVSAGAAVLNVLASGIGKLSQVLNEGSGAEKAAVGGLAAAGGVGVGLGAFALGKGAISLVTGGAALTGAATALDASAAALTAAAARIAGGAAVSTAMGGAAAAGAAGASAAAPSIWSRIGAGARGAGGYAAAAVPYIAGAGALIAPLAAGGGAHVLMPDDPETLARRRRRGAVINDARRQQFNEERRRMGLPELGAGEGGAGGGQVEAKLTGEAEVKGQAEMTVKIEAPELIQAYHDAKRSIDMVGTLRANGPGSTGRSSPDAAPSVGIGSR